MAFKINVDSNSYSSQAEKTADNYVLTIAKKLINDEAGARENEDSSLSRRIDKNLESIESLNEFRTAATEELSEKELLANKTEYISTAPSHEKYPTEQAVVEFVEGLGEENGGHVHPNKQALDTIYEEDIQRWDRAAENVGGIALMPLAERVNTLIDDVDSAEEQIEVLKSDMRKVKGLTGKQTTFNDNSSITETYSDGNTKTYTFNDTSVTESDNSGNTKITTFHPDGSITEVMS